VRGQLTPGARARILPDGVAPFPGGMPARAQARAALALAPDARFVALPGRLSSWKGQDVLLQALVHRPRTIALLAGAAWRADSGTEPRLRALAARLGVADRVRFLGFRDPLAPVLAAADVVVVPSTRPEPLGNAALEAALAGRPVIAAAHGGLAEAFTHERTALLVPPGDAPALAAALLRLEEDPALGARLAGAARDDIATRFAPERLLARLQDLYDELIGAPGA
jgi:glycosyltransferase involved in cell wall biosynthesis